MERRNMRREYKNRKVIFLALPVGLLGGTSAWGTAADSAGFTGSYAQNFDTLPYQSGTEVNAAKPVTFSPDSTIGSAVTYTLQAASTTPHDYSFTDPTLSGTANVPIAAGMAGWWGMATPVNASNGGLNTANYSQGGGIGQVTNKLGAQDGGYTGMSATGGVVSFGGLTSQNRSLGMFSTATVGGITTALALINSTNASIRYVTVSFAGDLWNQETIQKVPFVAVPIYFPPQRLGGEAMPNKLTAAPRSPVVVGSGTGDTLAISAVEAASSEVR
jgi:hypothetical protein